MEFIFSGNQCAIPFIVDVTDDQLSESSAWNSQQVSSSSRLNSLSNANGQYGSWTASSTSQQVGQWIQVDFGERRRSIYSVATQGHNGQDEWVTSYKIGHSDDGSSFSDVLGGDGNARVFTGNTDRNTVVTHLLDAPVTARYFRLFPLSWNGAISMRWELYGCHIGKTAPFHWCWLKI